VPRRQFCAEFSFHIQVPLTYRGRMQDAQMVEAILAGQEAGLATAYDRYAASLYGYCHSLLAEPADAAAAVQDTFIVAAEPGDHGTEPAPRLNWPGSR
jgi:DNA-directed RNA polymerase specialized sigma24 family protein